MCVIAEFKASGGMVGKCTCIASAPFKTLALEFRTQGRQGESEVVVRNQDERRNQVWRKNSSRLGSRWKAGGQNDSIQTGYGLGLELKTGQS